MKAEQERDYKALYGYIIKACKLQGHNVWETAQMIAHVKQAMDSMTDEQARQMVEDFSNKEE